jgi:RNA polymerase sigma-70 factor (ECF subfamily)
MSCVPDTRTSLVFRVRNPQDAEAWREFLRLYGPLIYRYGRRHGLQDADAVDFMQRVLLAVSGAIRRLEYDSQRGLFRGWLFAVVRQQFTHWLREGQRWRNGLAAAEMAHQLNQPPDQETQAAWDEDFQAQLLRFAADNVRRLVNERHWDAFWRTAVENQKAPAVAAQLGMSIGAVYTARSRILQRIRDEVQRLDHDHQAT